MQNEPDHTYDFEETTPLPSTLSTQQSLVASALMGGCDYGRLVEEVSEQDFEDPDLRMAWKWMGELFFRNEKVSLMSLHRTYEHLQPYRNVKKSFEGVKPEYGEGAIELARILRERTHFRRIAVSISSLNRMVGTATHYAQLRSATESLLMDAVTESQVTGTRTAKEIVEAVEKRIDARQTIPSMRTGFPTLDRMSNGGFKEKKLVVIAGPTGGGKTVLAMNIAVQIAKDGNPVTIFSLEMDAEELMMRTIASEGRVCGHMKPQEPFDRVKALPIRVCDNPDMTIKTIYAMMRMMQSRHAVKVFVVDYLQLIGDEPQNRESRERVVAGMSRRLKIAAKTLGVCVISLSQVNEAGELRESRAIEQDADMVLHVINNGEKYWLRVSKNRGGSKHGPIKLITDQTKDQDRGIILNFDAEYFRFTETARS